MFWGASCEAIDLERWEVEESAREAVKASLRACCLTLDRTAAINGRALTDRRTISRCVGVIVKIQKRKCSYVTCDANTTFSDVAQGCRMRLLNFSGLSNGGDGDGVRGAMIGRHDELFSVPRLDYSSHVIHEKSSHTCLVSVSFSRSHDPVISNDINTSYGGSLRHVKQTIDSSQEVDTVGRRSRTCYCGAAGAIRHFEFESAWLDYIS